MRRGFDPEGDPQQGPGCEPGPKPPRRPARGPASERCNRMGHTHGPLGASMRGPGMRSFDRGGIKFAVLEHLKEKPGHGYDIIRAMEQQSGGFYSPSPGAIYPNLQALEDQGFVTSTTEEGKKVYSITDAGLDFLKEHEGRAKSHRERWEANWGPGPGGEGWGAMSEIRETLGTVGHAVKSTAGDPDKLKEIGAVLQEAAAKIKEIVTR